MNNIDIWNDLGNLYLKANAIDAAIDAYNKALEQGYQSADIYKNLASAYVSHGNLQDSIPMLQKSIDLLSDDKERAIVFTVIGDCYRRMADFDNAIASFKKAIDLEPGNPGLCVGLGQVQRDLERLYGFEKNDDNLPSAEESSLANDLVAFHSPMFLFSHDESSDDLTQGVNRSGLLPWYPLEELAEGLMNVHADSQAVLSGTIEAAPENPGFIGEQASPVEAIAAESLVVELDHSCPDLFSKAGPEDGLSGRIYIPGLTGDELSGHESSFEQNLDADIDPEKENGVQATMLLTLGIMHWRNGSLDEADAMLQSAINYSVKIHNPWFQALSWNALALVKTALGDIVAAIQAYLKAVELAPGQFFPWNNVGSLYGSLDCHDKALKAFLKAIRQYPEDSVSWDGLGDIYAKLGRMDDAIAAYQLGNVFEKRAQGADAIKTYEKALDFYQYTISSFETEVSGTQENCDSLREDQFTATDELQVERYPTVETLPEAGADPENGAYDLAINISAEAVNDISLAEPVALADEPDSTSFEMFAKTSPEILVVAEDLSMLLGLLDEHEAISDSGISIETPEASSAEFSQADISENLELSVALVTEDLSAVKAFDVEPLATPFGGQPEANLEPADGVLPEVENNDHHQGLTDTLPELPRDEELQSAAGVEVSEPWGEPAGQTLNPTPVVLIDNETDATNANSENCTEGVVSGGSTESRPEVDPSPVVEHNVLVSENLLPRVASNGPLSELPPVVTIGPAPILGPESIAANIAAGEVVVRENPKNDRAWDKLGNLYRISQRNPDATHAYEQAVALEPTKYIYHYQLGAVYAAEGNYTDAIGQLLQVVELNPTFIFAHCALASYMRKIGKQAESQAHIEIALPHMAKEKEYDRACFESIRGNIDKALELLTIALDKNQTTIEWIRRDLDLDFIRQDPRYKQFEAHFSQSIVQH
ncbi:MAG: tetratricopeptide repeat protein [Chloroflexi bacterium]|nr:tetratricopeptide repeat protein [Chloroflexota bacterium]